MREELKEIMSLVIIVGIIATPIVMFVTFVRDSCNYYYDETQKLEETGDYYRAILKHQEKIDKNPNSTYASNAREAIPRCHYKKGLECEEKGDYSCVIKHYEKIRDEYPNSEYASKAREAIPRYRYKWGLECEEDGYYSGAIRQYKKIRDEYPNSEYASKVIIITDKHNLSALQIIDYFVPILAFGDEARVSGKVKNVGTNKIAGARIRVCFRCPGDSYANSSGSVCNIEPGEVKNFNFLAGVRGRSLTYTSHKIEVVEILYRVEE